MFSRFDPTRSGALGLTEFLALTLFLRSSTATFNVRREEVRGEGETGAIAAGNAALEAGAGLGALVEGGLEGWIVSGSGAACDARRGGGARLLGARCGP